jgi:hypothetical protein
VSSDERPAPPADPTPPGPAGTDRAHAKHVAEALAPGEHADDVPAPAQDSAAMPAPAQVSADVPAPAGPAPVPDAATLESIATPAELRRAPKVSAFITTGVLVGVVVGWLLAVLGSGTSGEARTGAILLTAGGLGALGAVVGSGLAALADRRSVRSRRSHPGR